MNQSNKLDNPGWSDEERARLTDERDALEGFGAGVEWLRTRGWIGDGRGAA